MDVRSNSKVIAGEAYHRFHPATVKQASTERFWDGLHFTHYVHPKHFRGAPRPATTDHILAFGTGGAVKGENAINSDRWRPYAWHEEEWFMGPAFGNDRDSCWDTLCDETEDLNVCYLHLSPHKLKKAALEVGVCDPDQVELPIKMGFKDPFMFQIGLQIKNEVEQSNPFGQVYVDTLTNMLALHLLRNYCEKPTERLVICRDQRSQKVFRSVLDYIQSHLNEDLSLKALSDVANMSEFHFAHTFKEIVGMAPHQYVVKQRCEKAKLLLRKTSLPIEIIAGDLGYSTSYFIQIFKRFEGVTPNVFRKKCH